MLIALGAKNAGPLLKNLAEEELEDVTLEISKMKNISSEIVAKVLIEFHQLMRAQKYATRGGNDYAQDLLENAFGKDKAVNVLSRVKSENEVKGFKLLKGVNAKDMLNFLQKEHPQTIALILANMDTQQAAEILSSLQMDLQAEVAYRLATMGKTSPELLEEIEEALTHQMEGAFGGQLFRSGGVAVIAEILNASNHVSETSIIENILERDPELATQIKKLMFVFEDLIELRPRDIQRILKDIAPKTLATALKIASEELKEYIFQNMSEQAAEALKEELEYLGPVRVHDVEEVQRQILDHVQELEEADEILGRGGTEDFIE